MIDDEQPQYEHDAGCGPKKDLKPTDNPMIKMCVECQGLFDARTGEGLRIMDKRIVG